MKPTFVRCTRCRSTANRRPQEDANPGERFGKCRKCGAAMAPSRIAATTAHNRARRDFEFYARGAR